MPRTPWWRILFTTWTGRLILVNAVVFVLLSWESGSIWEPTPEALLHWGAKDPALLVRGEWWRFITPMFVHIGIIHFAFNSWALFVIGQQLEMMLRPLWFLVVYFVAGLAGGVSSAVWSLSVSAGASGAIFGLLGAGFYIERLAGKLYERQTGMVARGGAYTGMLIANLALGFIIPQIDNAAHLGGLVGGLAATAAILWATPNRLVPQRRGAAMVLVVALTLSLAAGMAVSLSPAYLTRRVDAALKHDDDMRAAYQASEVALALNPHHVAGRLFRARVLVLMGKEDEAAQELAEAQGQPGFPEALHRWKARLEDEGYGPQAERLYARFASGAAAPAGL